MPGNIFGGGGMFGKPLKVNGQQGMGAVPIQIQMQGQQRPGAPAGPLGVVPPASVASQPAAPRTAMGPNGPVPLGDKKDCPICRG